MTCATVRSALARACTPESAPPACTRVCIPVLTHLCARTWERPGRVTGVAAGRAILAAPGRRCLPPRAGERHLALSGKRARLGPSSRERRRCGRVLKAPFVGVRKAAAQAKTGVVPLLLLREWIPSSSRRETARPASCSIPQEKTLRSEVGVWPAPAVRGPHRPTRSIRAHPVPQEGAP